jgi:hypothetical protein
MCLSHTVVRHHRRKHEFRANRSWVTSFIGLFGAIHIATAATPEEKAAREEYLRERIAKIHESARKQPFMGWMLGSRDGLELAVLENRSSSPRLPDVCLVLHNGSKNNIPFTVRDGRLPLSYALYDESGKEIALDPQWKARYEASMGTQSGNLDPRRVIVFTVRLDEVFGDRWIHGKHLKITWNPGTPGNGGSWPVGGPFTVTFNLEDPHPQGQDLAR